MQDVARLLFVRVHIGRGQDPCISEQVRCTRRTPTAGGVDGVKTVRRARARRTRRTPTASGIDGVKMVGRAGGNGTISLLGLSSFAGAAHAKDSNGQWSRPFATKCAETEPEPSSRTGRRCGEQRRTSKGETKTGFITVEKTLKDPLYQRV